MLAAGWGAVGNARNRMAPQMAPSMRASDLYAVEGCYDGPKGSISADVMDRHLGANGPDPLDQPCMPEWLDPSRDRQASNPPREILEILLTIGPAPGQTTLDLLASLGVPGDLIARLRNWITRGTNEDSLVRIFVALLARSPAGARLTPEQRLELEGEVFTNRALRAQRAAVQRLLAGVTEDSWNGVTMTSV